MRSRSSRRLASLRCCLALWCALEAAPALAAADRQLAIFDCGGTATLFELAPLAQVAQLAMFDAVGPAVSVRRDGCNVRRPALDATGLSADLMAAPAASRDGQPLPERYIRWRLAWSGGPARALSGPHAAAGGTSATQQLLRALGTAQGRALRPYLVVVGGRPALTASDAGVAGSMALAELRPVAGGPPHFATIDLKTGRVRVVTRGPLAHQPQLHLSVGGARVLVEELTVEEQTVEEQTAGTTRSGRVFQFASTSGALLEEDMLDALKDAATQVVCLSDRGTLVLAQPLAGRMWVAAGGQVQEIAFRAGPQEQCAFR
jgi:hypothetical protein